MITLDEALAKGHGQWRSFTCPSHDDKSPSARVNTLTGKWVCMVCGAKGNTAGYVPDIDLILEEAMALLQTESLVKPESWLDQFDSGPIPHYWRSRFSEEVCRAYRLGWDGTKGAPCYPVRDMSGRPLGITHRNIDDPGGPKYKYPKGVLTSELLFGVHELVQTDEIFLVEGATAVCAVRECEYDAVGSYGSRLYEAQVKQVIALSPRIVYLAYDMDSAGYKGAGRAEWDLNLAGVLTRRVFWDPRWNDLGDMDLAIRSKTLAKALAPSATHV
jgi:ribosomal protein L37AE/L43A